MQPPWLYARIYPGHGYGNNMEEMQRSRARDSNDATFNDNCQHEQWKPTETPPNVCCRYYLRRTVFLERKHEKKRIYLGFLPNMKMNKNPLKRAKSTLCSAEGFPRAQMEASASTFHWTWIVRPLFIARHTHAGRFRTRFTPTLGERRPSKSVHVRRSRDPRDAMANVQGVGQSHLHTYTSLLNAYRP
jgi:hypothetical protein